MCFHCSSFLMPSPTCEIVLIRDILIRNIATYILWKAYVEWQARRLLKSLVIIGALSGLILGSIGTSVPWLFPKIFSPDREVIQEVSWFISLFFSFYSFSFEFIWRQWMLGMQNIGICMCWGGLLVIAQLLNVALNWTFLVIICRLIFPLKLKFNSQKLVNGWKSPKSPIGKIGRWFATFQFSLLCWLSIAPQ